MLSRASGQIDFSSGEQLIAGIALTINLKFAMIMHPIGAVGRTTLYNMVLILTSNMLCRITEIATTIAATITRSEVLPRLGLPEGTFPSQEKALKIRGLSVR